MKTSFPIFVLRRQAKELKNRHGIAMSEALNRIAIREGFTSWSLLMSGSAGLFPTQFSEVLEFLNHGDLALIGARPGVGKTSFATGMFVQAIQRERPKGFFFTLVETPAQLTARISRYDENISRDKGAHWLSYSNEICADYIIREVRDRVKPGSLIVIDYLQLLSEKRVNPPLQEQVAQLKKFASESGCIVVFICQLDRQVESRDNQRPTIEDIRLPNPLDLGLLNKVILLYRETRSANEVEVSFSGRSEHDFKVEFDAANARFVDH